MKRLRVFALLILPSVWVCGQQPEGDWQGTLKVDRGLTSVDQPIVFHFEKSGDGTLAGSIWRTDWFPDSIPVTSVTVTAAILNVSIDLAGTAFNGEFSADGQSISGNWVQQGHATKLELRRPTRETAFQIDPSPHQVQFVSVDKSVKLEVVDWGGSGSALVFLAGLGNTAHVFDKFALNFTRKYHVYGITRRGFGRSSVPPSGYTVDRLALDVLEVMESLKLNKPVLVGHSIAGEELSFIGSRYPEKVAGLIYLDAAYAHAFYDSARGDLNIDSIELAKKLDLIRPGAGRDPEPLIQELLQTDLPRLEHDLREQLKDVELMSVSQRQARFPAPFRAVISGQQKLGDIRVPVLAIYAIPRSGGLAPDSDPAKYAAAQARDTQTAEAQARAFEAGVPTARVVRMPNANHYVFLSNDGDVWREMNNFLRGLQ
jgi:pimeloyl-ACP methyl ester carboxylesterase